MKRIIFVLLLAFLIVSCEDTQNNVPAMQGSIENVLFKANDARAATIGSGGALLIEGLNQEERFVIRVPRAGEDVYDVAVNRSAYGAYVNENGAVYSSFPFGEGEIAMTRVNTEGEDRITGTFKFTAMQGSLDTIYIERGIYFEVPIIEGIEIDDPAKPFLGRYGTMSAVINGEEFRPKDVQGEEVSGGIIFITGVDQRGNSLRLRMVDYVENGVTYNMDTDRYNAFYKEAGRPEEQELQGSLTIININNTARIVSGTFTFTTASYEVISGEFFSNY